MEEGIKLVEESKWIIYGWIHTDTVWNYSNTECIEINKNNEC